MENIYQFSEPEMLAFFLILVRLSAFVVSWPVFGVETVPTSLKILFALLLALMIFPVVGWSKVTADILSEQIIWLTIREAFIGLFVGYIARFFFFSIRVAGEMISVSMGLSGAQLFNPSLGGQSTAIDQFHLVLATLFYLAINGHHLLLAGIIDSFRVIPIESSLLSVKQFADAGQMLQDVTLMGLKMSAPVMISVLFLNLTMAVIGRAVPQINVLITSLPVNILVGFLIMIICIPMLVWQMNDLLEVTTERLFLALKLF